MNKLQKYNNIAFAVISVPFFILAAVCCFMATSAFIEEMFPSHHEWDNNNGVISQEASSKNAKEKLQQQYITYNSPFILTPSTREFVIPVVARTMEKKERFTQRFALTEMSVDEVVFDDSGEAELRVSTNLSEKNDSVKKRVLDSTIVIKYGWVQFVNLYYENPEKSIKKSLIEKRFTGWNLKYIQINKDRYLTFLGAETDTNNDGFLNNDDKGALYIYNLNADSLYSVAVPNMLIEDYLLVKNTSMFILDVTDPNRPKSHKNEEFLYRFDIKTGVVEDMVPDEEKQKYIKLIL